MMCIKDVKIILNKFLHLRFKNDIFYEKLNKSLSLCILYANFNLIPLQLTILFRQVKTDKFHCQIIILSLLFFKLQNQDLILHLIYKQRMPYHFFSCKQKQKAFGIFFIPNKMLILSGLSIKIKIHQLTFQNKKAIASKALIDFFFDFFKTYVIFCFISQIQFQANMESYSEYMFQLPTTQDSLAEFRRKTNQQPENIKNIEDINPQSLPPLTIIPRRRRRQRQQHLNSTVIRVKPLQQITSQQKKQTSYPPFVYEDLQQSIVSKKIQDSFTVSQKSSVYRHKMSTKQTKQFDHEIVSYNSQQQEQLPRYQEANHQVKSKYILKAESLRTLIKLKVPQKYAIKCLVKITKRMFSATVYDLYLQQDKKLLLRAIKSPVPFTRTFTISDPTTKKQLGKVFKNFTGTQYILVDYDNEKNKQKQILWVSYRLNIFGLAGQNTINVLRPNRDILKTDKFSDIKAWWENGNRKKIEVFTNKLAIKKNGNYQIDFHGMVTTPSSKNFIIDDENGLECILFGKRTSDIFALNITNSMTILEAFAMALSSLDGKLLVH